MKNNVNFYECMVEYRSLFKTKIGGVKLKSWRKVILLGMLILTVSINVSASYAVEDNGDYEHNYNLGQFHMGEGEFDLAIPFYLEAIEQQQDSYEAYMGLANTLLFAQRYEDLAIVTTEMISKFPWSSDSYMLRAQAYLAYQEYSLSKMDLIQAIKIDENNYNAHLVLGNTMREAGEYDEAIVSYKNALGDQNNRENVYMLIGETHARNNDLLTALNSFEKAIDVNPDSFLAHLKIASLYTLVQEYDIALGYYEKSSEIQSSEFIYVQMGAVHLMNKDVSSAVISFERAIAMDETNVELIHEIAATFMNYDEYSLTEKYLDRALKQDPENAGLLNGYAVSKNATGTL